MLAETHVPSSRRHPLTPSAFPDPGETEGGLSKPDWNLGGEGVGWSREEGSDSVVAPASTSWGTRETGPSGAAEVRTDDVRKEE
jgi:hypothetical protein